eukprot:jgi/Ulvmu1/9652/UM054_0084.1
MDQPRSVSEDVKDAETDLTRDVIGLQDAIQEHQASLAGVPEGLRKEASELRAQLSCMGLLDRLEQLKGNLVSASEADGTVADVAICDNTPTAMNALCDAEQNELDADLQEMSSALNDAKETAAKLETDKMRLQKELLELQLLINSGHDPAEADGSKLSCIPEQCIDSDPGSPRISAVPDSKPPVSEAL